jgi:hypothetical protein
MLFAAVMFLATPAMAYDVGRGEAACPLKGKEALVLDVNLDAIQVVLLPEGVRATLPMVSAGIEGDPFPVILAAKITGAHVLTGSEGDQLWLGVNWGHALMCWGVKRGSLKTAKDAEQAQPLTPLPPPATPPPVATVSAASVPLPPAAPAPQAKPPQAKRVPAKPRVRVRHRPRHRLLPVFSSPS